MLPRGQPILQLLYDEIKVTTFLWSSFENKEVEILVKRGVVNIVHWGELMDLGH